MLNYSHLKEWSDFLLKLKEIDRQDWITSSLVTKVCNEFRLQGEILNHKVLVSVLRLKIPEFRCDIAVLACLH